MITISKSDVVHCRCTHSPLETPFGPMVGYKAVIEVHGRRYVIFDEQPLPASPYLEVMDEATGEIDLLDMRRIQPCP